MRLQSELKLVFQLFLNLFLIQLRSTPTASHSNRGNIVCVHISFFPVVSIARGPEFPQIATPVLPSAVALYMLGMLMTFNSKINFFAFILILHWAVIAVSKVEIFDIPEDLLLAAACVPAAVIFLTRALKSAGQDTKPKIFRS